MIIKAPTGLYQRLLPSSVDDSTPVTYTISNNDPPPIPIVQIVMVPKSIILATDPVEIVNRDDYGELIYSVVQGNRSEIGSNKKVFEVGEILNSDDDAIVSSSAVVSRLTIQHNTNILDLESLGLTDVEILQIIDESNKIASNKHAEIASLQTEILNIKIRIRENQKLLNECNKAIKAVSITFGPGNEILDKLETKLIELEEIKVNLNSELTDRSSELTTAISEFIDISQVVR